MPTEALIAKLERVCDELAHCSDLSRVRQLRDQAAALSHYARCAKVGLDMLNKAAEVKLRAERRAGQMLADMALRGGDRVSSTHHDRVTLEQLNITPTQSARWQRAAQVPEEQFTQFVHHATETGMELSTAALLRLAAALDRKCAGEPCHNGFDCPQPEVCSHASSVAEIIVELQEHCSLFQNILAELYDAPGPVALPAARKRHLRTLVQEFASLLQQLHSLTASAPPRPP